MKKLLILTVLLGLNTLTVSSQTVVSNEQLDWLFVRNNDAVRFEKELANCDSTSIFMETKIDRLVKQAINKDSIVGQKDAIIRLQRYDIEQKRILIVDLNDDITKRNKIIKVGGVGLIIMSVLFLLK